MVEQGRFRGDLLHRLMGFPLYIPPLRERREDIQALVEHYLPLFCAKAGCPEKKLHTRALEFFQAYHWPGNVRELINVLQSAVLVSRGPAIVLDDLAWQPYSGEEREAEDSPAAVPGSSSIPTLAQAEKDLIERSLRVNGGNKSRAARMLGISRSHLRYRMMLHDL
jgi:DNA-binding NtrC family response regulator